MRERPSLSEREERLRDERLAEIRAQIADGTLLVRHMTAAEHEAALEAARRARAARRVRRARIVLSAERQVLGPLA